MNEELKKCPFCGGEAKSSTHRDMGGSKTSFVGCRKCHAYVTSGYLKIAIKVWNKRVKGK